MNAYARTLARGRRTEVGQAPRAEAIAMFCETVVQTLAGAVSPKLVWEGAVARGLSFLDFGRLCGADVMEVEALQWTRRVIVASHRDQFWIEYSELPCGALGPYTVGEAIDKVFEITDLVSISEAEAVVYEAHREGVAGAEMSGRKLPG